jgi:hypothetical protein
MEQEQKKDMRTSKDLLTQISTDIFLIKEKFSDQEFKQIMEHTKLLFEKLDRDRTLIVEMLNRLERLKMNYMRLAETNEVMYRMFHDGDYHEGCDDHYIHHQ